MIAVCPKCSARYRIAKEKLKPEGVRMRCGRCDAVFRVRAPAQAPAPAATPDAPAPKEMASPMERPGAPVADQPGTAQEPQREAVDRERLVLVAIPDAELAKQTASVLGQRGLHASIVHDGVEAMLEIQRQLPRVAVLSATLPKMYGFQICEVMKRNESLRSIQVVLAGSIHHADRYRREPSELYGADAYLEDPDLPGGLIPILERIGVPIAPIATPPDDGLTEERAKAERLARIIVSDVILYNEDKFAEALRRGCVVEMMSPDLDEGRGMFCNRIDERVRDEQDYLVEELLRVARLRGEA